MPLAAASPLLRRLAATSEDRTFHGLLDPGAEVGGLDAIRIFESVHRQLARQRAAALFVDDLQWVDPLSLALCHFLVRATAGSGRGLALVVASRPSPIADRFAASLATVIGDGSPLVTLHVRPLDRDDGVRLVSSRAGSRRGRGRRRCGNGPADRRSGSTCSPRREGDERDVDAVVAARTRGLGADANAAARDARDPRPAGRRARARGPGRVARGAIDRATADLVERGLAIDDGGTTRLAHDLIRDVVVSRIPAATRRELEGRIATSLEERAGGDVTVMLAALEHRVAAGSFDADLALRILRAPQRRLIGSDGVGRVVALGPRRRRPGRPRPRRRGGGLARRRAGRPGPRPRAMVEGGGRHDRSGAGGPRRPRRRVRGLRPRAGRGGAPLARRVPGGRRRGARAADRRGRARGQDPAVAGAADGRRASGSRCAAWSAAGGRSPTRERPDRLPPGLRTAYVDALIAAWEGAIQAEDVDAIVSLADESLEASRALGLREVLDARTMVGMALEYGPTPQDAAGMYRQVWDEAWRAVLPIEAIDAGYRLASGAGRRPGAGRRAPGRRGGRAARGQGGRPRPRPRPDPAGEVPGRDGDVRLAGGGRRDPGGGRGRARSALPLRPPPARGPVAGPGRRRRGRGDRPHGDRAVARGRRGMPRLRPGHGAVGRRGVRPVRIDAADGRRGARQLGRAATAARTSRRSGCDAASMRCSRSATGSRPSRPRPRWRGCATRPKATAWPSTRCGRSSTSADASHRPTAPRPRRPIAGSPSAPSGPAR